jgi:hypothetical protein
MVEGVVPFMAVCLQVQAGRRHRETAGVKDETPDDAEFAGWDSDDDRLNLLPSVHHHLSEEDPRLARLIAIGQSLCCA